MATSRIFGMLAASGVAASAAAAPVIAPSQITPGTLAPGQLPVVLPRQDARELDRAGEGTASAMSIAVGEVTIENGFPELADATKELTAQIAGQTVPVSRLFATAQALERAYARQGFALARVTIPEQRLTNQGPVRIVVTDGYIEAIDTSGIPLSALDAVIRRLTPLLNRRHIRQSQIERQLMLAGEVAGLALRSGLAPGSLAGATRLVVAGTRQTVSAGLSGNNRLPASLGSWQLSANGVANDVLGLGEQLYLTLGSDLRLGRHAGSASSALAMQGGGIILPFGHQGLTLAAEYIHSRTTPRAIALVPDSVSDYARGQIRVRYPLLFTRRQTLILTLSGDTTMQALRLPGFDLMLSRDRYATGRAQLAWQGWHGQTALTAETTFSQGIAGRQGNTALPNSRATATADFARVDGVITLTQPIWSGFGLGLTARGQSSLGHALFVSEQFALDAERGVSAFAAGTFSVDSGVTLRGELVYPARRYGSRLVVEPYLYAAGGAGWIVRPTTAETGHPRAASAGFGARIGLNNLFGPGLPRASIGAEFGHGFSNIAGYGGANRASLTLAVQM